MCRSPMLGFQPDDVVGALVADELVGGDVHELDILRHDEMGGYLIVDVYDRLLQVALEDTCIILRETVDVTYLYRIGLCSMYGH